jgi:uncharacterized protein YggE
MLAVPQFDREGHEVEKEMREMNRLVPVLAAVAGMGILTPLIAIPEAAETAPPTVSVSGSAAIEVIPDEVTLILGVETWHPELSVAKRRNSSSVEAVIQVIKSSGVRPEKIQTDHIDIVPTYQEYSYPKQVEGYFVRRTVVAKLHDLSKFDDLLSRVIEEGANYVHGIEFATTELRRYRDEARALAMQAAREKAEALSSEAGCKLGQPVSVREDYANWWSGYSRGWWGAGWGSGAYQNVIQNAGVPALAAEGGFAPGQIQITAQVSATFEMCSKR